MKDLLIEWNSLPLRKKDEKLWLAAPLSLFWAIWKERNRIVFEDATFFLNRLKLSFVSSLNSWAGLLSNVTYSIVRILVYSLGFSLSWVGIFFTLPFPFCTGLLTPVVYPLYTLGCLLGSHFLRLMNFFVCQLKKKQFTTQGYTTHLT